MEAQSIVPFEIEENHILIDVEIESTKRKVYLDLGAMANIIPSSWIGNPNQYKIKRKKVRNPNGLKSKFMMSKDLGIGVDDLHLTNLNSIFMQPENLDALFMNKCCRKDRGILGADYFLRNGNILIFDFVKNSLSILEPDSEVDTDGMIALDLYYKLPFLLPFVKLKTANGQELEAHFDTGYSGFLSLPEEEYNSLKQHYPSRTEWAAFMQSISENIEDTLLEISEFCMNTETGMDLCYEGALISKTKYTLLGMQFALNHKKLIVDYQNDKLYISAERNENPEYERQGDIKVTYSRGRYYLMTKRIMRATDNLDIGEEIHGVNGFRFVDLKLDACCQSPKLDSLERVEIKSIW